MSIEAFEMMFPIGYAYAFNQQKQKLKQSLDNLNFWEAGRNLHVNLLDFRDDAYKLYQTWISLTSKKKNEHFKIERMLMLGIHSEGDKSFRKYKLKRWTEIVKIC